MVNTTTPHQSGPGHAERRRTATTRWRRLIAIGAIVSLFVHVCVLIYLSSQYRLISGPADEPRGAVEFSIMANEDLSDRPLDFDHVFPDDVAQLDDTSFTDDAMAIDADFSAADVVIGTDGARARLGGAGAGQADSPSLGGGGGGATFFGISSKGTRFAYIVDRSTSMERQQRLPIAKEELVRSLRGLPDYAQFIVVFYSSEIRLPPMQRDSWLSARRSTINRFVRWLDDVTPEGGTHPQQAFMMIFALDLTPDAIFFLTDGEIPADTVQLLRELNRNGRRGVVINTISIGDGASHGLLQQIANESGGVHRHVTSEGY